MTELLTAAQMRAIEQAAITRGEVTGLELMERAGRGVVEAILEWRPELATAPHKAVLLCGPGNNGGDGFVAARRLRDAGWPVRLACGPLVKKKAQCAEGPATGAALHQAADLCKLRSAERVNRLTLWAACKHQVCTAG